MSLIHNVKIMSRNHIIFNYKNNYYYKAIDNDNKLNIFNKNLMNIFLDQFSENIGKVTYDDIIVISVLENHDNIIRDLPKKLRHLIILSTYCHTIEFNNEVCLNIEHISIDKSNITSFPNISNCVNLKTCKILHSAINNFDLSYDLPNSLYELNLQGNLITNSNFPYEKLLDKMKQKTLRKINLSDNYLNYNLFPETLRLKCNLIRQYTYIHHRIEPTNVANVNIANIVNINMNDELQLHTTDFFSSQNVHLSSINKSVINSVNNIKTLIEDNGITIVGLSNISKYNTYMSDQQKLFYTYFINCNVLFDDFKQSTKNSVTFLTYKETFELIWSLLCFMHDKGKCNLDNAVNRIKTEIEDGSKMCFTGKYNRLINSMVGIIEGVQVGFSEGEELQLEFGKIIKRFNDDEDKEYTFNNLLCDSKELLKFVKAEELKQPWIDAIYDLMPEPEIITYNGNQYWRTFHYDVLDIYDKSLVGYYMENPDRILYLHSFDEK